MKKLDTWNSWSSWSSPVGLGLFFLTTALALAIGLYALLNLIGTGIELFRSPAPSYSPQEMQQMMQTAPATSGSATGATQ